MSRVCGSTVTGPFAAGRLSRWGCVVLCLCCWLNQAGPLRAQNDFMIDRNTLEAWIFQRHGNRKRATEAFKAEIDLKLKTLRRRFELSEEQEATLRVAASGDIKRFLDKSDALTEVVAGKQVGQNEFNVAWQLTMPLQNRLQKGLFEDDSLFHKVLLELLDNEQAESLEEATREAAQRKRSAVVRAYIAAIERGLPLTADQRTRLEAELLDRVKNLDLTGQYALYIVSYSVNKIPEETLAGFLDQRQMEAMNKLSENAQAMRAFLLQQGLIFDDEGDE